MSTSVVPSLQGMGARWTRVVPRVHVHPCNGQLSAASLVMREGGRDTKQAIPSVSITHV